MFIPPEHIKPKAESTSEAASKIRLKASHLLIDHELAAQAFKSEPNVCLVYYKDRQALLLAPPSDDLFKKLHKASQHMLKDRNLKGDKTIALHEIIIDHQLDDSDRDLEYEFQVNLGILNVKL